MISACMKREGGATDTLYNIRDLDGVVRHIVSLDHLDAMNASSANLPPGESEVVNLGLDTTELEGARLSRLAIARVAFACSLYAIPYL